MFLFGDPPGTMGNHILILHGPNLNLLGRREPHLYGTDSLEAINEAIRETANEEGLEVEILQSNHEGELVEAIHRYASWADVLVINPAAYGHTSLALRDAISGCRLPTIEVHLSNIYRREEFRHRSFVAPVAIGQISGFGKQSYVLGIRAAAWFLKQGEASA